MIANPLASFRTCGTPQSEQTEGGRFFGKYRGTVVNNIDPLQMGRIQVIVPDVSQIIPTSWAMPCLPIAGKQSGSFMLPQIGAGVWVEFEQGDPDFPIWVGCYWGSSVEVPALALAGPPGLPNILLQSSLQHAIMISDLPGPTGGILMKTATGAFISVSDVGILIDNGKGASITLAGPTVMINKTALTVT
jgi:hypothetical protein